MALSAAQIQQFKIDGYLLLRGALEPGVCEALRALTAAQLAARIEPFELEAEIQYPGAPASSEASGGDTIRRLLQAEQRAPEFSALATHKKITHAVQQILACEQVWLNPNHHNCVMTKQPAYSSETWWHRDTRYWNFSNKYLINAWVALGQELAANGAMKVLPGSHRWEVQDEALDGEQFLLKDHPFNVDRLATARTVELQQGDILLFSAHCFHAAGKNTTDEPKFSAVFTYHSEQTQALPSTRSAAQEPKRVI